VSKKSKKLAQQQQLEGDWFEGANEIARAEMPDSLLRRSKRNRWRLWIIATIILAPITIFVALAAILSPPKIELPDPDVPATAPGRPEALRTVQEWLTSTAQPIPFASAPVWAGSEPLEQIPDETKPPYEVWLHKFEITTKEVVYVASVPVGVSGDTIAVLAAPSLESKPTVINTYMLLSWPGTVITPRTETIENTVATWVRAYLGGDPVALLQVTGDPDLSHGYLPLAGYELDTVAVTDTAYPINVIQGVQQTDVMLARASFTVTSKYGAAVVNENEHLAPVTIEMDLLLWAADTATPQVVAWGPAGSGTLLTAYQNAVPIELLPKQVAEPKFPQELIDELTRRAQERGEPIPVFEEPEPEPEPVYEEPAPEPEPVEGEGEPDVEGWQP